MFEITKNPRAFQCKCGFTQGHVGRKGRRFEVRLLGPLGDRVRLLYTAKEFWTAPVIAFISPQEGEELGFLGEREQVDASVSEWKEHSMVLEDFVNPDIMYAILTRLQNLADQKHITCECERPSVGIDVYPDKVELVCSYCGSAMLMGATTSKDLERVHKLSGITMERSAHTYLDEWLRPLM